MSGLNTKEMMESRTAAAVPCRSIVRRRVSRSAYLRAIETEGPHVATKEGDAWWREQERRHPFIMAGGNKPEGTDSPNGSMNKFGKVSRRFTVSRGWERYEGGEWHAEESGRGVTRRRGGRGGDERGAKGGRNERSTLNAERSMENGRKT